MEIKNEAFFAVDKEFHTLSPLRVCRLNRVQDLADRARIGIMMRKPEVLLDVGGRMVLAGTSLAFPRINFPGVNDRNDKLAED